MPTDDGDEDVFEGAITAPKLRRCVDVERNAKAIIFGRSEPLTMLWEFAFVSTSWLARMSSDNAAATS